MFKLKEKNFTGYFLIDGFQVYLENGSYSTKDKNIIKVLKADDRFIEEKKEPPKKEKAKAESNSDNDSIDQPAN